MNQKWTYIKNLNHIEQYDFCQWVERELLNLVIGFSEEEKSDALILQSNEQSRHFHFAFSPNLFEKFPLYSQELEISEGEMPDNFPIYDAGDERNIMPGVYKFLAGNRAMYLEIIEKEKKENWL